MVDDDVDIRKASDVEWAMATRLDPAHGIVVIDKVTATPDRYPRRTGVPRKNPLV